jgi:hypothetical protein
VTEQLAQCQARPPSIVRPDAPRRQIVVDVGIEIDAPGLDQLHDSEREHRLADRAALERRIRGCSLSWRALAKAARPSHFEIIDHSGAYCGRAGLRHPLRDGAWRMVLARDGRLHAQIGGDPPDSSFLFRA